MIGVLQQTSSLLAKRVVFHSHDLDETRHHIAELFVPHTLKVIGKHQTLAADIRHADFDPFTFAYVKHGANVDIDPGKFKDFFMIQIPLRGMAEVQVDGQNVNCSPDMAVMLSPTLGSTMQFRKDCEHLNIRIEKNAIESYLEQQLQRCLSQALEFVPGVALTNQRSVELLHFISFLAKHLNQPDSVFQSPVIRKQLSDVLMNMFLLNMDHNYHEQLCSRTQVPRPAYIKKAQAYIQEHAQDTITPAEIALVAQTSTRSLYAGFRQYLDTSPMAYLKSVRLDKVHEVLTNNAQGRTVSEIALEHGFTHLGHFSNNYQNRFGELPVQTLKRSE